MVRVLQVYPQMNNAGTERVIMNLYENIDLGQVQFDFLVEKPGELDETITNMGGKIYYIKSDKCYEKKLEEFFKEHPEYQIVHTHTHANMGRVLEVANRCGVKCRIAHSHNARNDLPKIAAFIKGFTSIKMEKHANYFFACSANAAKWLFPHKKNECKVLYNAINLEKYLYQQEKRECTREILGITKDEKVLIHVGRFATQKNHEFLIKIFDFLIHKKKMKVKLLLVGVGPLQKEIEDKVEKLKIQDKVLFLGNRSDVEELLSASDLFVFPSLHEGLGIVVIEAQASGLKCIVSDAVPEEADLGLDTLNRVSLQDKEEYWGNLIQKELEGQYDRSIFKERILNSNYNIKMIARQMQEFYLINGK